MDQLLRDHANAIVEASIKAVLPDEAVRRALDGQEFRGRVLLVSAGKAAWQMAKAAYDFWGDRIENGVVVTNFGNMTPDQGYKTQTVLTLVMGVASIIGIFILSLFF